MCQLINRTSNAHLVHYIVFNTETLNIHEALSLYSPTSKNLTGSHLKSTAPQINRTSNAHLIHYIFFNTETINIHDALSLYSPASTNLTGSHNFQLYTKIMFKILQYPIDNLYHHPIKIRQDEHPALEIILIGFYRFVCTITLSESIGPSNRPLEIVSNLMHQSQNFLQRQTLCNVLYQGVTKNRLSQTRMNHCEGMNHCDTNLTATMAT